MRYARWGAGVDIAEYPVMMSEQSSSCHPHSQNGGV